MSANEFNQSAEQDAVWSISDKHPTAAVTSANDSLLEPLRQHIAWIKEETLPWYRLVSKRYVYPNGAIVIVPLLIKGVMMYSNDKENYATLSVINEKGLQVCQVKNEWLKAGVNENYKLELPVKGLAKGKYTIELKTSEQQLVKREFEI